MIRIAAVTGWGPDVMDRMNWPELMGWYADAIEAFKEITLAQARAHGARE